VVSAAKITARRLAILLLILSNSVTAQFYHLPAHYAFSLLTEKRLAQKDSATHSAFKPHIPFFSAQYSHVPDSHRIFKYIIDDPALDIAVHKHVITVAPRNENFTLTIDPILNVNIGNSYDFSKKIQTSTNTRGVIAAAQIGKDFYFETLFAENQSVFPQYLWAYATSAQVVPGQGRWKVFKKKGFDYAFSSGFISYQPSRHLNIQLGHGKQKIGFGYRSLLLSDNSFNYPYARITQQWLKGKLQYTNVFAVLMNMTPATKKQIPNAERLWQKKPAAFQYLSYNPCKWLNLGLFQGVMWEAGDSLNRQRVTWSYFNPVIAAHMAQYGLNHRNNVLAGADIRIKLTNTFNVYGQVMADDLSNTRASGNGTGFQAGFNYYDALGLKNLFFQFEYNRVSETSYTGPIGAVTNQSYSHYNQNLAFTLNQGEECVMMIDYKFQRIFFNVAAHYQIVPRGGEKLYDNRIINASLGYLINPSYNLNLSLGYTHRNQNFSNFKNLSSETNYIYLALRTSIYNFYYDF
jgi:hypothetical protein